MHSVAIRVIRPYLSRNQSPTIACTLAMNWRHPWTELNAEWLAGELQSVYGGSPSPRASAITAVILAAVSRPPWPGLAPCERRHQY